ncbi:MAG TPA: acyl-CoA dehydrogenase family protein [Acidimicrobiales bacterium]|nr:acyl-CoA dehydrogenase family protein [Acidimicrobiales bacterium]
MPPSAWAEEHEELRAAVRELLADISPPTEVRRLMATAEGLDPVAWKRMADLGLLGLAVPARHGGSGLTLREAAAVFEETGAALLCAPLFATVALATNVLLCAGDDEAAAAFLPPIVAGEWVATVALGEGGEDATRAEPAAAGEYLLHGHMSQVLDGATAHLLLVVARAPRGTGVFAVRGDAAGLTRTPLVTMDQTRKQAGVRFDATPARLVGRQGLAPDVVRAALDRAAVALAAEQLGGARRCLQMAADHACRRLQFGRPVGSFGAVKHELAGVLVDVEAATSVVRSAAWTAVHRPDDLPVAAAVARAWCSGAYRRAAACNIQVHGGIGFTWDHDAHLHFKRATSSALLLGGPAAPREAVARHLGL